MIVGIALKDGTGYPRFAQTWLATDDRIMETKRPPYKAGLKSVVRTSS